MRGEVTLSEGRSILAHLLTDCEVCRQVTGRLAPFGRTVSAAVGETPAAEPLHDTTTALLERIRERERAIEKERAEAAGLFEELEAQGQAHRMLLVRNSDRFLTWGLAELLIDESFSHRFNDRQLTSDLADLAVEVAERLDPEVYGAALVNDLQARAWANRGNAQRLRSELRSATRCLNRALKLIEEGTGDPLEEARVCELFAALRSNQSRVELAVRLQERAMRLYRRAGHRDKLGKAMVDLASYHALVGDRAHAIDLVKKALLMVDGERDPHTVLAARHNLAVFLQESGRLREALEVLAEAHPLYERLGDRYNLLKLRRLEGNLAQELGDFKVAEQAYEEVYEGFVDVSAIAAARVALDLASLYLESGCEAKVPPIVAAVEKVFRAQGLESDALSTWLVLREAIEQKRLHTALLEDVAVRLDRLRDRPNR
jgi:tetratricopeptide (TPR) repeat protein